MNLRGGLWLLLMSVWLSSHAAEPDWGDYGRLLAQHGSVGMIDGTELVVMDYPALKRSPLFGRVVSQLASFNTAQLSSPQEKLAFYINAYNILAMKVVVDHWPLDSIRHAGNLFRSVWKKRAGLIDGREVSLHEMEHEILRPMGEPRIHFAIVCASVSCPDLRGEPYLAARLDEQLDEQVQRFLANDKKGLKRLDGEVHVSRIFRWFEEDFVASGGVGGFLRRYVPIDREATVEADLDYNWSLNQRP